MHIVTETQLLAWSTSGDRALVEIASRGPEGGGSLEYAVLGAGLRVALSRDFSPGDGSTPQTVTVAACQDAAKTLALALVDFPGVAVSPRACKAAGRAVVAVAEPTRAAVASRQVAGPLPRATRTPAGFEVDGAVFPLRPEVDVALYQTEALLVAVATDGDDSWLLAANRPSGESVLATPE